MEDKERTEVVLNAIASDVNHDVESESATEVGAGPIELARRVVGVMVLNDNRPNKHAREERDDKDATPLDTGLEPGRTSRPVSDNRRGHPAVPCQCHSHEGSNAESQGRDRVKRH